MSTRSTTATWTAMVALTLASGACAVDLGDESWEGEMDHEAVTLTPRPRPALEKVTWSRHDVALRDTDGDGLADLFDVCRLEEDPGQADWDGDGVGDACDCSDGRRGPAEDGVDCGGPCAPCATTCTNGARYAPYDTPCTSAYPTDPHRVDLAWTDGDLELTCRIHEVCDPDLDFVVAEALECCDDLLSLPAENGPHDATCQFALDHAWEGELNESLRGPETAVRRCSALYIIRGLGRGGRWMTGYDLAPVDAWEASTGFPAGAGALVNDIGTGICRHYSTALTTLLRKAGLLRMNVAGGCDGAHCYNTVRLPGDVRYHVVDTTGNWGDIEIGGLPGGYPYCFNLDPASHCYDGTRADGRPCDGSEPIVWGSESSCWGGVQCGRDHYEIPDRATPFGMIVGC